MDLPAPVLAAIIGFFLGMVIGTMSAAVSIAAYRNLRDRRYRRSTWDGDGR